MMVTIVISCCPQSLRGDLTKWLLEVDIGVYVGRVTARVGEMLWCRIEDSIGGGHAVMIATARNEQHFVVKVHNSNMIPVDFEGITLMMNNNDSDKVPDCYFKTD